MTNSAETRVGGSLDLISGGSVLVGHDGSEGAQAALVVALELADQLQAPVVLVRSWSIATASQPDNWAFGYASTSDEWQQGVLGVLMDDTEACRRRFPAVEVTFLVPNGGPSQRLIELSKSVRLLVVGAHGKGGFAELVRGSVSDQCVRYAHCPVLVVKNPRAT